MDAPVPVIPEYRLTLEVDFAGLRWNGTVELDAPPGLPRLELDAEGLTIASVHVGGREVPFVADAKENRLSFELPPGGARVVSVAFSGAIETKNLFGFYRARHGSGYVLTTHCEPTGARRIFPCIDRPDRKARIALTVRAAAELEVISNTPVRGSRRIDGRQEVAFEPTPLMSTYLFYLGIGRFDSVEDRSSPVSVRVAAAPGRGEAGRFALRAAGRILRAYEEYYGIAYPLRKLDLIAIAEHAFGAMENWGAISYQETRLLVDATSSSAASQDVFITSAHEIAHQWFGNLVTMSWWDDVWLNESFATLMEAKITDLLEPSFGAWSDFIVRTAGKAAAIDGDSLRSSHPVRAHVERPEELSQIFDAISYGKGASVLAMLDRYLGEATFRAGVTDYLNRFRFRNARTEDLFSSLERASGVPVATVAAPWIDRPGLPLVRARRDGRGVTLRQSRFFYGGSVDEPPWPIPMVVEVDGKPERLLFDRTEMHLETPPDATVLLNPRSTGFYRVLYDRGLLDPLLASLPNGPGLDAWAVLDDLGAFVLSGDADWATYARAVAAFRTCPDRLVGEALAGSLVALTLELNGRPAIAESARQFLAAQLTRVGVDRKSGEDASLGILRDRLAFARVRIDDGFANEISPWFDRWAQVDPDLRTAVAIARVRTGADRGFEAVDRTLATASTAAEALRLERALAWSGDPGRVAELLGRASAGKVNRSHILTLSVQAALNPAGRAVTWAWLQENLDGLTETFRGSGYLPLLLEYTLPVLGLGRSAEVRRFFDGQLTPEGSRGLANGLERLELLERLAGRLG